MKKFLVYSPELFFVEEAAGLKNHTISPTLNGSWPINIFKWIESNFGHKSSMGIVDQHCIISLLCYIRITGFECRTKHTKSTDFISFPDGSTISLPKNIIETGTCEIIWLIVLIILFVAEFFNDGRVANFFSGFACLVSGIKLIMYAYRNNDR